MVQLVVERNVLPTDLPLIGGTLLQRCVRGDVLVEAAQFDGVQAGRGPRGHPLRFFLDDSVLEAVVVVVIVAVATAAAAVVLHDHVVVAVVEVVVAAESGRGERGVL